MRDPEGGGRWGNHGFPHPERPGPVRTGARGFEAHCSSPLSYGAKRSSVHVHRRPEAGSAGREAREQCP